MYVCMYVFIYNNICNRKLTHSVIFSEVLY